MGCVLEESHSSHQKDYERRLSAETVVKELARLQESMHFLAQTQWSPVQPCLTCAFGSGGRHVPNTTSCQTDTRNIATHGYRKLRHGKHVMRQVCTRTTRLSGKNRTRDTQPEKQTRLHTDFKTPLQRDAGHNFQSDSQSSQHTTNITVRNTSPRAIMTRSNKVTLARPPKQGAPRHGCHHHAA